MRNVTDRTSDPFGMRPPCERFVPGYGDANAHFHLIGDHPGVHGGADTGVPFTNGPGLRLQEALRKAGLLESTGEAPTVRKTFLSYLHMCVPEDTGTAAADGPSTVVRDDGAPGTEADERPLGSEREPEVGTAVEGAPTEESYGDLERFFDAELRAIAAHVLLPVGERATRHVLVNYTAQARKTEMDMERLHGREIRGSGFLVVPVRDPGEWTEDDDERLVSALRELQSTDYRREVDLGRFGAGDGPYFVR